MYSRGYPTPPPGQGGYGYSDRDEWAAFQAWKSGMYHQEMDYMQQQRYWHEMESRRNYEAAMRQRMAYEQSQGECTSMGLASFTGLPHSKKEGLLLVACLFISYMYPHSTFCCWFKFHCTCMYNCL